MQQSRSINIFLIEDDPDIIDLLRLHFTDVHFSLTACSSGKEAIELITHGTYDLILLDIMLPDCDGFEVCRIIRERRISIPIIMLTSRSEEIDKVVALELGADDYLTKPFSIRELLARTKAVLRRSGTGITELPYTEQEISVKELYIHKDKKQVTLAGKRLELTAKEFDLLFLLASNPGQTFSRQQILQRVWGYSFSGYEHTVTSHVNRLRLKLEKDLHHPQYILTAWGTGYRFTE